MRKVATSPRHCDDGGIVLRRLCPAPCLWRAANPISPTLRNHPATPQTSVVRKTVYISLGSNTGDREQNLRTAIERLRELGEVKAVSSIYETEPVEYTAQPWFLNAAVALETELMPRQFMSRL